MGKNIFKFIFNSNFNFKNALKNYKLYDTIEDSNLFDEEFYTSKYPDIAISNKDPLTHYLFYGYKEGKIPSLDFDSNFYLNAYPDIKEYNINPLLHYISHGIEEGRIKQQALAIRRKEEICETNLMLLNNYKFGEEPLVSIIILNLNGLNHLQRLFKNFNKKTNYNNYEIIVIDNGSSDKSVEYLNSLKNELPIKIIENSENVSFSKGNNDGAKIAKGEYLLFLNNDIEPTYGWLNEMVGTIVVNEKIAAVGAKLVFPYYFNEKRSKSFTIQHSGDIFSERMKPCCLYAINKSSKQLNIFDKSLNGVNECISVTGAVMLVKKSIYHEFGGFDEGYNYGLEDVDFCLKLNSKGYKTLYCGSALLFHHESSTRLKSKSYFENDKRNYEIFWSKWGDYLSKNLLLDKIHNKKFFTEKQLDICIFDNNYNKNQKFISSLSKTFNLLGYEVDLITNMEDYYLGNSTDILLSFSLDYDLSRIISRKDLFKICILYEPKSFGDIKELKDYDMIITSNKEDFDNIQDLLPAVYIPLSSSEEYGVKILDNIETILNDSEGFI